MDGGGYWLSIPQGGNLRLDAAEWSLFLAVSPVTCRLHSKGPRVLNFHSNGACSLGWTTYITIVSALAAASDHGFSCHLEAAAWLSMVPTVPASACMSLGMMGGSIYYEAGSVPQPCPTKGAQIGLLCGHMSDQHPPPHPVLHLLTGFDHSSHESSLMQASHCRPTVLSGATDTRTVSSA